MSTYNSEPAVELSNVDVSNVDVSSGTIVFSKSSCPNCDKVTAFLTDMCVTHTVVKCDQYLANDREGFLRKMSCLTGGVVPKVFPMVFIDSKYIGGYTETLRRFENEDW